MPIGTGQGLMDTVESGLIQTVANVVTRMTIPSWAAQPGSLANSQEKSVLIALSL